MSIFEEYGAFKGSEWAWLIFRYVYKQDNVTNFLFACLHTKSLLKLVLLEKEKNRSLEQIISFMIRLLFRRGQNIFFYRIVSV